jgi:hypothetical protein
MKRAELSLFFNFKAAFEHMVMHFKDSMVMTFESDVYNKPNYKDFTLCLETLRDKKWDCVHVGGNGLDQVTPFINGPTSYRDVPDRNRLYANAIEDLSSPTDALRFSRRFHTRCCDSLLWKTSGCERFVQHMCEDTNYDVPFDYYFINKLENDMSFKHYWSYTSYFDQASNNKLEPSTIQSDMS